MIFDWRLIICCTSLALVHHCTCIVSEKNVKAGDACDPAVDKTWYPVTDEFTSFLFCSPSEKKYVKNSCPELKGRRQLFNSEAKRCFTPRSRTVRTPGIPQSSGVGDACRYNTDCMNNMYCPSGTCSCVPGYVGNPSDSKSCLATVNPGQQGCTIDAQCNGAWPLATCSTSGVCTCPALTAPVSVSGNIRINTAVPTQDGVVCVALCDDSQAAQCTAAVTNSVCATPIGYIPANTNSYKLASLQLTAAGAIKACDYQAAGNAPCGSPELYDCIPQSVTATTAGSNVPGVCCPSRAFTCIQPKFTTNTPTSTQPIQNRWWYNSITNECEMFQWASPEINPATASTTTTTNNFVSQDQCYSYCRGTCQRGQPLVSNPVNPPANRVTVCTSDANCPPPAGALTGQTYTCKLTANPRVCCPTQSNVCTTFVGGRTYASNQPGAIPDAGTDAGTGPPTITRYYWNPTTSTCTSFPYKLQEGNFNNFLSAADCQAFCTPAICTQGTPLQDFTSGSNTNLPCSLIAGSLTLSTCPSTYTCTSSVCCPRAQTICTQPQQVGTCTNAINRYWYNAATQACELFTYTGCSGNDNNFLDFQTCTSFCASIRAQPTCAQGEAQKDINTGIYTTCTTSGTTSTCSSGYECTYDGNVFACCPTKVLTCNSNQAAGVRCVISTVNRYFYNTITQRCESFAYNGCDGNSNNFISQDACERYCLSSGCPYGGVPYVETGTSTRRVCSSTVSCPTSYECQNVVISNAQINACCLTRTAICSENLLPGNTGIGTSVPRYYFNRNSRQCLAFQYFGPTGNENNFATATQCNNFCMSAACLYGESAQMGANQQPVTCNQQVTGACQPGYTCRTDSLFNRQICCGSTDMGVCPSGERAFVDPFSLQPRECILGSANPCPGNGYLCRSNLSRNRNYCCASLTGVFCPTGKAVLRDAITRQPRSCFPSITDQCQTTGYSCQPLTAGTSGYCCTNNALCPNNANFLVDSNQNPQTCIIVAGGTNPCGATATCQPATPGSTSGYCCQTTTTGDGCPVGQPALVVGGVVQTCGGTNIAPFCPAQSTCLQNTLVTPARFQCCTTPTTTTTSPTTDPDGCGIGLIAYRDQTNSVVTCQFGQTGVCPTGFNCQLTSSGQQRCCGTSAGCPTNTVAQINDIIGLPQTCVVGQACSSNAFQCSQTTSGGVCCSTNIFVGTTPGPITTAPPIITTTASIANRCPFPNQTPYIAPGTTNTMSCSPRANTCPNAYPCLNNGFGFICCQPTGTVTYCATGSVALLNGQPQSCIGTSIPCPANYACRYSTSARNYYCCPSGGTTIVTPAPSTNPCPGTRSAYYTPGSRTPASCNAAVQPGATGACPNTYSCVFSSQYGTTICCSTSGSAATPAAGCPTGAIPYITPGASGPSICTPGLVPPTVGSCPVPYACVYSSVYSTNICCSGTGVASAPIGNGQTTCSPFLFPGTQLPLDCTPKPDACPPGHACMNTSQHSHRVCCLTN